MILSRYSFQNQVRIIFWTKHEPPQVGNMSPSPLVIGLQTPRPDWSNWAGIESPHPERSNKYTTLGFLSPRPNLQEATPALNKNVTIFVMFSLKIV